MLPLPRHPTDLRGPRIDILALAFLNLGQPDLSRFSLTVNDFLWLPVAELGFSVPIEFHLTLDDAVRECANVTVLSSNVHARQHETTAPVILPSLIHVFIFRPGWDKDAHHQDSADHGGWEPCQVSLLWFHSVLK